MSEKKYFLPKSIFILLVFSSALYSQQAGWFDRFFPKKAPSELTQPSINPPKSLVEPHPDALALQESFAQVVTAVQPAVVNISAVQITRVQSNPHEFYYGDPEEFFRRFFEGPQRSQPQREYQTKKTNSKSPIYKFWK
jgi:S1-C subfamily serine protease